MRIINCSMESRMGHGCPVKYERKKGDRGHVESMKRQKKQKTGRKKTMKCDRKTKISTTHSSIQFQMLPGNCVKSVETKRCEMTRRKPYNVLSYSLFTSPPCGGVGGAQQIGLKQHDKESLILLIN